MNSLLRIFAAGSLLAAVQVFAADSFEGKVTMNISASGKGESHDINYSIKGQKVRIDMEGKGNQATMIMDAQKLETLMLMPEQRMYMVMPMKKPVEQAVAKQAESTAEVERTGKTETILGHQCEQILVKDKGNVTEVWVAKDLGAFMGLGGGGPGGGGMGGMFGGRKAGNNPQAAKWEEILKDGGGFPLRVVTREARGKESYKMEVTKITPGSLPASDFEPPAGYQQFQMPDVGGMNPFKP